MSQSGPNTTRALANARAPRIRRRQTPSASVSPAFVRPANYRQMPARTPARNPRTQPVQTGPAFVRPAHYRRMQDHMEMPARLEMLGDIFLDVFNTPPPRINRGNLFTSVGPPDKNFRLPTSSAGMDRLYNQLMLQGRKIDRVFSETHSQTPIHRTWTLNTYMAYFKERDIDVDHQGAVRYLAKAADSKWKSLDLTGPQRPILDKGFAYDITVETIVSTSSGLRSYGTFLRSARITVNRPSDLETPILDCRFSPEESNANEENQQAHLAREMARHDATGSAISPPENDPFWIEADSWKTVFSSADTLVTFTQVVNITSGGSSSLADMRIATPKTIEYDNESIADTAESISDSEDDEPVDNPPEPIINCLIDIIRSRFTARIDEIENERLALPVGKTGRPKKGEVRDLTARRKRNMLNEHQKNIEARMNLLDKINERVVDEGGLQHGDDATLNEIVAASSAAFIQFICPLQQYREIYWRIDNPRVQNARENGVPRTGITAFLVSPVHVVNMDSGNWVFSSETVTKLNADQMRLKREELRAKGEMTLVTPSNNCKAGQLIRTLSGEVFAFHNEFSEWKKEFWDKQVNKSRMNTTQYDMPVISIIVASALLTGRARFQLYNEIASKYTVTEPHTCIVHKSIGNFDQKKAYTHAFDSINHRFMGSEGLCMGKIAESFLITNQQEMIDMLDASGIEGLLVIDQDSVDLTCINSIEMKKHFRNFDDNLDLSQLTDEKVADTIKRLYTINVVDKEETRLPRVLTFIEARFLIACGVTFTGLIALVSYNLIPIEFTEESYEKYGNIAHYAKAVGLGMHIHCNNRVQINGSKTTAHQFFRMALEDPKLNARRIQIKTIGQDTIEIEHPANKISTLAHVSAYIVAGQRMQLAMQVMLIPNPIEAVTDGVYALLDDQIDYDRLMLPYFIMKNKGSMPAIMAGCTLNGLKCGMAKMKGNDEFEDGSLEEDVTLSRTLIESLTDVNDKEIIKYFKPRRTDLLGKLNRDSCKPTMVTGWAGSGKTTTLSQMIMDGSITNTVFCSPTQQLRVDAAHIFPQTMCHPRITGKAPPITDKGINLSINPPAVILVDESTMLSQVDRGHIEDVASKWGSKVIFIGDYSEKTGAPMQIEPIGSASMNTEGMQVCHVSGVKRTNEHALIELCGSLRDLIENTAGGIYIGVGFNIDDENPADSILMARRTITKAVELHNPNNVLTKNEVYNQYKAVNNDVILAATRMCVHCAQGLVEKCKCDTATCFEDLNFASEAAKEEYIAKHTCVETGKIDIRPANKYSSVALDYIRRIEADADGKVMWKCIKVIPGTDLKNGSRFVSDILEPTYQGQNLTELIGKSITQSPTSTIHAYQGITFKGNKLFIDLSRMWDIKMLYVAISRIQSLDQLAIIETSIKPNYKGESDTHRLFKAREFAKCISPEVQVRCEYPVGDGRYIADIAVIHKGVLTRVIEIVVTSPPSKEKLEYYAELNVECTVVYAPQSDDSCEDEGFDLDEMHDYVDEDSEFHFTERIDTTWVTDKTPEDELELIEKFSKKPRTYMRKKLPSGAEYGRAYACGWSQSSKGKVGNSAHRPT